MLSNEILKRDEIKNITADKYHIIKRFISIEFYVKLLKCNISDFKVR